MKQRNCNVNTLERVMELLTVVTGFDDAIALYHHAKPICGPCVRANLLRVTRKIRNSDHWVTVWGYRDFNHIVHCDCCGKCLNP